MWDFQLSNDESMNPLITLCAFYYIHRSVDDQTVKKIIYDHVNIEEFFLKIGSVQNHIHSIISNFNKGDLNEFYKGLLNFYSNFQWKNLCSSKTSKNNYKNIYSITSYKLGNQSS